MLPLYNNGKNKQVSGSCWGRNKFSMYFCFIFSLMLLTYFYFLFFVVSTTPSNNYDDEFVEEFEQNIIAEIEHPIITDNYRENVVEPEKDDVKIFEEKPEFHENIVPPPARSNNNNQFITEDDEENRQRRKGIRDAFIHSFRGYEQKAWGFDELKPISGGGRNWVQGGIGMTIIDSIDTAAIMGLEKIVEKCLSWIKVHLNFNKNSYISVFETTIRIVGGLISAYDLIGDEVLLEKAEEIATRLLPAFNTKDGVPLSEVNLKTGKSKNQAWANGASLLAEFGTLQIEFRRLSYLTKNPIYDEKVTVVMDFLDRHSRPDGQYPCFYENKNMRWRGNLIKWGAWGDSMYEYIIKQYLLTNETEERYRIMYDKTIDGMHDKLVKKSNKHTYIVEVDNGSVRNKMDHLVCFAIGMLVIGAKGPRREKDLQVAKELGETCYNAYISQESGLAPDSWRFTQDRDFIAEAKKYLLRPETVEGLFYLFRATGDKMYRDWGWKIFQAIDKHCKTNYGYATVSNVGSNNPRKIDEMHTFFLGETLKYLYLLFCPEDIIPLDKFVFNTEAHPLRKFDPKK